MYNRSDVKSQIDYAVNKYGGNLPKSVARANAEKLARDAMLAYNPSKGNVKTYLSKRLQKLSRTAYKASIPVNIPESRLMSRSKIRDFIDEYKDTYGSSPSINDIVKYTGVPSVDAKNYMRESASISSESLYDNIHGADKKGNETIVVQSLPEPIRGIGEDIYLGGLKEKDILKKHKIGRTTYFSKKKKIDNFIKQHSGLANVEIR